MGLSGDLPKPVIMKYCAAARISPCASKTLGSPCTKSDRSQSLRRVERLVDALHQPQGCISNAQGRAAACRALFRACRGKIFHNPMLTWILR